MSRPKGGEGASVCVADVLDEVLSVRFLIWHDTHLAGSIVAVRVNRTRMYIDSALHAGARTYVHARNMRVCVRAVMFLATYRTLIHLPYMDAMVQGLRLKHTMHGSTADGRSFAFLRVAHKLLTR